MVLFVFNRPEHTRRTVEALGANSNAGSTPLVVYSDAARDARDESDVAAVRAYIHTIRGFRDVRIVEQARNLGLAGSVISGVTDVMGRYGCAIVLEDDMETASCFLDYMNDALRKYRDEERVYCIHGYSFPADLSGVGTDTFFLRGAECWGWATWKRAWDRFCPDAAWLHRQLRKQGLAGEFDYGGNYAYMRMLERQSRGQIDSWAIRWRASAFVNNGLTLWPKVSLVRNFGMDGSGVHCDSTGFFDVALATRPVLLDDLPLEANSVAYRSFGRFLRQREGGLFRKAVRFIRRRMRNVVSDR